MLSRRQSHPRRAPPAGLIAAVDLGAASGARLGLFGAGRLPLAQGFLPRARYGASSKGLAERLARELHALLARAGRAAWEVRAVGLASPGLFRADGSYRVAANLGFLKNADLKQLLADRLGAPVALVNDGDAGAIAEWSVARRELLYWVLGGGWGGAWVSARGEVLFPATGRDERRLHYTNEPGYAIPLAKSRLDEIFACARCSFDDFERVCRGERDGGARLLRGPSGAADCVRAETVVSGPGRWRIFQMLLEARPDLRRGPRALRRRTLANAAPAGETITRLGRAGHPAAVLADQLFGLALAEAALLLWAQARRDGCPPGTPIYLAGGPSLALPLFGPYAHAAMRAGGMTSRMRWSAHQRRGQNANLLGAAFLAKSIGR